jgi:hypothetical protein
MTEIYGCVKVSVYLQPTWKWSFWIFTYCSTLTEGKRSVHEEMRCGKGGVCYRSSSQGICLETNRTSWRRDFACCVWLETRGRKRENRRVTPGNSFRDCLEKRYKASPSFRPKIWHARVIADIPSTDLRPRLEPHNVSEAKFVVISRWDKKEKGMFSLDLQKERILGLDHRY